MGGYYDPPYKCRVPNPSINPKKPRNTKRYSNQQKVNKPPTKYGKYIDKKSSIEYQNVSMRIPKELYSEYKNVLAKTGSIVTYDVRNHMKKVVEEDKKGQKTV